MLLKLDRCNRVATANKYGWHLRWSRVWIITLGLILLFLCLCIAGMEIGHTLFDVYRSTAFAGLILFIPLLICTSFVLITACIPHVILLRITTILCCIMIILCLALITYDILVLIDPTRCFLLNCADANVTYAVNSTYNATITGWPIFITWPDDFRTNMNAKRIFQSIQLFCAVLFILFCSLYIITYIIYQRINLHQSTIYNVNQSSSTVQESNISPNNTTYLYPPYNCNHLLAKYKFEDCPSTSVKYTYPARSAIVNTISETKSVAQSQANAIDNYEICRFCMRQPRMISTLNDGAQNLFSYVCINCNNELLNYHRKSPAIYSIRNPMCTSY